MDSKGGNCFQRGSEARVWEGERSEFLTVKPPIGEQDRFAKWLTNVIVAVFRFFSVRDSRLGTVVDEESALMSFDESKIN